MTLPLAFAGPMLGRVGRAWPLRETAAGRALGWFWLGIFAFVAVLALVLQLLGPPAETRVAAPQAGTPAPANPDDPPAAAVVSRVTAGPLPALLEPAPGLPGTFLPRVGADGRTPMQAYAAPFTDPAHRPRIAILLAGMGLNGLDSETAIAVLPAGTSLAFSPYAQRTERLLDAARARGQELLVSLPLEPEGAPMHDAGDQALLVGATPEQNRRRLDWSLSRFTGYAGLTGALGALRGERFAESDVQMREMLQDLGRRGLLYVDPRPGGTLPDGAPSRAADLILDAVPTQAAIARQLAELEGIARERGSAVGLAGAPLPVTIGAIAAWAAGLEGRGFVLAPVTALVAPPNIPPTAPARAEHAH